MTRLQFLRATTSLAFATAALFPTHAFTYADRDVILVFRKPGRNDVIHNLGQVDPFLAVAPGATLPVTNWNLPTTLAAYDGDLTDGVEFIVMASTGLVATADRRAWATVVNPADKPTDPTASNWQTFRTVISAVGVQAQAATAGSGDQTYSVDSSDLTSYTYIMTNGGQSPLNLPFLGGASKVVVESGIPGTLRLVQYQPSTANPKPVAKELGAFTLTAAGALAFTAAGGVVPLDPPVITNITRAGDVTSITVATVAGAKYQLRASSTLSGTAATWPVVGAPVDGTGSPVVLTATGSGDAEFYAVENLR